MKTEQEIRDKIKQLSDFKASHPDYNEKINQHIAILLWVLD